MKTNPFITLTAGFAAILGMPAYAIEAPADDAPPPPPAVAPAVVPAPADAAKPEVKAQAAFLGVVSTPLPDMLADHLGLKTGEGIVVQALMPDGPAAKAGVAVHDVITRVADQPVASSADLTQQVAAHQVGDKIHLSLIHKGKPAGIDVTLGNRPLEGFATVPPRPLDQLNLDAMPKNLADRIRGMVEGNVGGLELKLGEGGVELAPQPQMGDAMREMKKRMDQAMEGMKVPGDPGVPRIDVQQGATVRMMDEQGSVELKSNDGNKEVTIRDKDNKITWTGPWDTEQDKAAAPQDVRQRVDRFHLDTKFQGNGLRLQMRQIPVPVPEIPVPDHGGE